MVDPMVTEQYCHYVRSPRNCRKLLHRSFPFTQRPKRPPQGPWSFMRDIATAIVSDVRQRTSAVGHRPPGARQLLWRGVVTAAAGVMGTVLVVPLVLPWAGTMATAKAVVSTPAPGYLALGDSITFGFREGSTAPPPAYTDARSFVGYPEDIGAALGWRVVNAACPGETAASFINVHAQSNGCETFATGGPGYRSSFPLHVKYRGPQLRYAVNYLRSHPETRLVSLMIGVNDLLACVATTADRCASEHDEMLGKVAEDVGQILSTIRKSGRYTGQIVVVNYYALNSANSLGDAASFDSTGIAQLNAAVDRSAIPFDVTFASGEGAYESAALQSGGDSCVAGLLTQLKGGGCGIHPSVAGQAVLALALERVIFH